MEKTRACRDCGVEQPLTLANFGYHVRKQGRGSWMRRCRRCEVKRVAAAYAANAERRRRYMKDYMLRRNYGITLAEYQRVFAEQGGVCAICGREPGGKFSLRVDHNHAPHQIRGLLCNPCNSGLGRLDDSIERLEAAIAYLRAYEQRDIE